MANTDLDFHCESKNKHIHKRFSLIIDKLKPNHPLLVFSYTIIISRSVWATIDKNLNPLSQTFFIKTIKSV